MIAILEREWKEGIYGKSVAKKAEALFDNPPISVTACYLNPSKYMLKFNKPKQRR
jgi:hypothetical protein